MNVVDRVDGLVEPLCTRIGVEMLDVEFTGGTLRITVDQPGGVGTEALAALTNEVSRILDHTDPISGTFTLEVTSPGLERRLRRPDHFRQVIGKRVAVKTHPGNAGDRRIEGVLEKADEDGAVVLTDDGSAKAFAYDEVQVARTVFVWTPEPKSVRKSRSETLGQSDGRVVS